MTLVDENLFPKIVMVEGTAPSSPSAGDQKLFIDSSDHHLKRKNSSGTVTDIESGGGGSVSGTYYGNGTPGGSTENMTQNRWYMKKITVSAAGLLTGIGAYIQERDSGDHLGDLSVMLLDDNSGAPGKLIATGDKQLATIGLISTTGVQGAARWVYKPAIYPVAAASYWICVAELTSATGHRIYYDTGGSDRYFTSGGAWAIDGSFYSNTTSSNTYNIRAIVVPMTIS